MIVKSESKQAVIPRVNCVSDGKYTLTVHLTGVRVSNRTDKLYDLQYRKFGWKVTCIKFQLSYSSL